MSSIITLIQKKPFVIKTYLVTLVKNWKMHKCETNITSSNYETILSDYDWVSQSVCMFSLLKFSLMQVIGNWREKECVVYFSSQIHVTWLIFWVTCIATWYIFWVAICSKHTKTKSKNVMMLRTQNILRKNGGCSKTFERPERHSKKDTL